ncbi:MAG: SAM-dependent methyltransferase [Elusimicrobiota bacterium]|jgi:phospholipid N-methyltransferase|nr:SAM-dependent methyltransferase [Elusimicrobiota bacterium]
MKYEVSDHLDKDQKQDLGAVYTPEELAISMAKKLNWKKGQKVLDVCCGKGNLFVAVLEVYEKDGITNDNLYGIDIDPKAIEFCINKFPGGHFRVGNCLTDDFTLDHFWKEREYNTQSYEEYCVKNRPPFKFGKL